MLKSKISVPALLYKVGTWTVPAHLNSSLLIRPSRQKQASRFQKPPRISVDAQAGSSICKPSVHERIDPSQNQGI
jgi:hypothetical protein